ncbi:MAG TPA: flagellin [Candidatus Paceibacterota bacterium]|nr:flagellin [Candidatus Paceibacterota bacterium]
MSVGQGCPVFLRKDLVNRRTNPMAGIDINYNASAVNSYNSLANTYTALSKVVSQLSSGLQIQSASDNPAGYVIGQYLEQQGNGYTQAISNVQSAVSVLQTAQGALGQEASILQTMNILATQVANGGTQTATTMAATQAQFASLQAQLDQIAASTNFGGTSLLDGSYTAQIFQVGPYNTTSNQVSLSIADSSSSALAVSSASVSVGTVAAAQAAMTAVQAAISSVALQAANVGATQNRMTSLSSNLVTAKENIDAAHANLVNVDVAEATTRFASLQILQQAGMSVLYQAQNLPSLAQKLLQ